MSKVHKKIFFFMLLMFCPTLMFAQNAYFIDGYHGGIWGHYPRGFTSYMVEQLNENPNWKINLEIEPETWDRDSKLDVAGYKAIKAFLNDNTVNGRVEYVNPTYAQPYMYNISGESIIRQFSYGINTLRKHFPKLVFKTYSSEEPCFTSALPQILKSFGYQYASLKNPNTGWGGYTRAYGKELVNWVGPDGSSILTSPRYQIEALKPNSTWETTGNDNNKSFINAAFADGIRNPVGMCLQDAGWREGPWLKGDVYKPSRYTTWRNYFENITQLKNVADWKFSQEDVLTSLVWGSQVLQQLAQQTRASENNIVQAEKIAVIDKLDHGATYPTAVIDEAWHALLLAQHHDCWIVPYNGEPGDTWADKVLDWTNKTNAIADGIKLSGTDETTKTGSYLKVYNTSGTEREEWIKVLLPASFSSATPLFITDQSNKSLPSQRIQKDSVMIFKGKVPAFGYAVFELKKGVALASKQGASIVFTKNGNCILETDLYRIQIDKAKGGSIKSLVAKSLGGKEFVDEASDRKFNELRGNFYNKGGFHSNTDKPANITVLENGPFLIRVKIESEIAGNPVAQIIGLNQGQELINFQLEINWRQNEGIGEFEETNYQSRTLHKAFYDDRFKLLTLFPLALKNQKVFKDAPFDVTESGLKNTFFNSWDSIKNNIMLSWVDVMDGNQKYGITLFTDHTTSYAHGENFPLGLTTQYSGYGLWGRNYAIKNATKMSYQLLPHQENWQRAGVSFQNEIIKEPLQTSFTTVKPKTFSKSFITTSSPALTVTSCTYQGNDLYVRVFNASKTATEAKIKVHFSANKATLMNLDGTEAANLPLLALNSSAKEVSLKMNPFGITTLKFANNEH
jgi:alpha-mannosidase